MSKRIRRLEKRVAKLEAKLTHRDWSTLPPANYIPTDELPALPDYTTGVWDDGDEWNPTGYI